MSLSIIGLKKCVGDCAGNLAEEARLTLNLFPGEARVYFASARTRSQRAFKSLQYHYRTFQQAHTIKQDAEGVSSSRVPACQETQEATLRRKARGAASMLAIFPHTVLSLTHSTSRTNRSGKRGATQAEASQSSDLHSPHSDWVPWSHGPAKPCHEPCGTINILSGSFTFGTIIM